MTDLMVYAIVGSNVQQVGGECPDGWIVMQSQRPSDAASADYTAQPDGTWLISEETILAKLAAQEAVWRATELPIIGARRALEKQQAAELALATLDQKAQKEKTDGLAENEKLRRAAADAARRLRIAGSCRADSGNVPGTASSTSLGNGGTVELTSTAGRTVFDIRAGIIADQAALRALQAYVMNVCR